MEKFLNRLKEGPVVLFLGQKYLGLENTSDYFIKGISKQYFQDENALSNYNEFILESNISDIETSLTWMNDFSKRISPPVWSNYISKFPWNCVLTSAIDNIITRVLTTDWRNVKQIYDSHSKILNPRNQRDLNLIYLFGSISQVESDRRPPFNKFEHIKRLNVATNLLQNLQEIVTPRGLFLIEGYDPQNDWLSIETLYPVISNLGNEQTHLFSYDLDSTHNDFINDLIFKQKLIVHKESLYSFFNELDFENLLKEKVIYEQFSYGKWIRIGSKKISVPQSLSTRVSKSAIILDEQKFINNKFLNETEKLTEFKNFLSHSGIIPRWEGYANGFAFKREFLNSVKSQVINKINSQDTLELPIIIYGQASSGKTISLGMLAYDFVMKENLPVLFIERRYQKPDEYDIDSFCEWAETNGAERTLIIWDGMTGEEQYYQLLKKLDARGRKVIVIGSTYKKEDDTSLKNYMKLNYIEAPIELSEKEKKIFCEYIASNLVNQPYVQNIIDSSGEKNFLAILYRYLPSSQQIIKEGLNLEADYFSNWIINAAKSRGENTNKTVMEELLEKAGLLNQNTNEKIKIHINQEAVELASIMMNLVMIPGQFGLNVPFDLLIRCLGTDSFQSTMFENFQQTDIYNWYDDELGSISVGPRTSLEAKLLVQMLGGQRNVVEYIKILLSSIKYSSLDEFDVGNNEIYFAVELLQQIGPNSNNKFSWEFLFEITNVLKEIRESKQAYHHRLSLQEASFLREIVKETSKLKINISEDPLSMLNRAEEIIRYEIEKFNNLKQSNIYSFLLVELSSILGTKVHYYIHELNKPEKALTCYNDAKLQILNSRSLAPENYPALDVLYWTTSDLINSNNLNDEESFKVKAELLHMFELAETEGISDNYELKFQERKLQIGFLLENIDLENEAFQKLEKSGSTIPYYLKAMKILGNQKLNKKNEEISIDELKKYTDAYVYLDNIGERIDIDSKCLYLKFRLWWILKNKKYLFSGEKRTTLLTEEDWVYCLKTVLTLLQFSEIYSIPSLKYLKGLSLFQLENYKDSIETFKELDFDSENIYFGRKRVIKSYLLSNEKGEPKRFSGQVKYSVNRKNKEYKGEIFVPDLRVYIPFTINDFKLQKVERDDVLNNFNIAFNFRGPIAIPSN